MRLFRYRRIDLFFCFSFFIAFSCLWFSFFSAGKEEQYRIDAERYSYGSNALLSVENMEESIDIEQLTESINGVVYIKDFSLYYDTVDEEILSRIILSGGEELRLPIEDHKVEFEKGILIGRNQSKARFLSKGGVLVDGSRIDFAGITGCKYSGYGSYEIIVPYRLLGDKTKERIKHTSSLSIVVSSEENDAYERAMTIKTRLENLSPGCEVMVNSYSESKADEKTHGDTTLMMLLTVFTFLACFIASELWMRTRTNELSILMIYGYKWWPLYSHFALEGLKLGLIAWVAGFLLFSGARFVEKDIGVLVFLKTTNWTKFLLLSCGMVCICVLGQFIRAMRNPSVAQVVKAGGE